MTRKREERGGGRGGEVEKMRRRGEDRRRGGEEEEEERRRRRRRGGSKLDTSKCRQLRRSERKGAGPALLSGPINRAPVRRGQISPDSFTELCPCRRFLMLLMAVMKVHPPVFQIEGVQSGQDGGNILKFSVCCSLHRDFIPPGLKLDLFDTSCTSLHSNIFFISF